MSRHIGVMIFVAAVLINVGCGRAAVRASEKEFLANQVMVFDYDKGEASADAHVRDNREGGAGGGTSGGGCGCN